MLVEEFEVEASPSTSVNAMAYALLFSAVPPAVPARAAVQFAAAAGQSMELLPTSAIAPFCSEL